MTDIWYDDKVIAHDDNRRTLYVAFNGEGFEASVCRIMNSGLGFSVHDVTHSDTILFPVKGDAQIQYNDQELDLSGKRIFLPRGQRYHLQMPAETTMIEVSRKMVQFPGDKYVTTMVIPFVAKQCKVAVGKEAKVVLGGHYHKYGEFFYVPQGEATFTLEDITTKARREAKISENGLHVPARVAHSAVLGPETILVGFTEQQYVSPAENDKPYKLE